MVNESRCAVERLARSCLIDFDRHSRRWLLGYPDASLAFDLYFDHPVREVPQLAAVVRRLERPAEGALLLRKQGWAELGAAAHPSWCPLARATISEREFILVGACR